MKKSLLHLKKVMRKDLIMRLMTRPFRFLLITKLLLNHQGKKRMVKKGMNKEM